jgi:glucose/arabinose dehydrogenase
MNKRIIFIMLIVMFFSCSMGSTELPLEKISLPRGFVIELYYYPVPGARSMVQGDEGTIFVGTRKKKVYAITDTNNDFKGDTLYTIADRLSMPNGVAFKDGSLYVAEVNRVIRFDAIEKNLAAPPKPIVVNDTYPDKTHHGWKYIAFGPDNLLYVPVGAPCNICEEQDPRFASIMRMKADGSGLEIFASGIRNTVGFAWHPDTKELWFTDNGRDWLGDNLPPDELNRAPAQGLHFGFPYFHGKSIPDPNFKPPHKDFTFTPPEQELGPHVAALGMKFYTGKMFPREYQNVVFIAEHGSWNREDPIGYRISMVTIKDNKAMGYKVFGEGWLNNGKSWGRPVDLLVLHDGSLLVSDDKAGAIYRIVFKL